MSKKRANRFPLLVVVLILATLGIAATLGVVFDGLSWYQSMGIAAGSLALFLLESYRRGGRNGSR